VVTPKSYVLYFKDRGFEEAARESLAGPCASRFRPASVGAAAPVLKGAASAGEVTGRALDNPEVRRFREVFGGEVRTVRNLKE
jgi:hypothetical protein